MGYDSNDFDDGSIERCPHCGGSGNVRAYDPPFTTDTYYYVVCEDCGAMTSPTANTPAEAVVKWNRRTGWEDYSANPDYDPRREDHRGGLQPESIIRNLRVCGGRQSCQGCSLHVIKFERDACRDRLDLAAADTIEHLLEREMNRIQLGGRVRCDFCAGLGKIEDEYGEWELDCTKITPLPGIDLTTGKKDSDADPPYLWGPEPKIDIKKEGE